MFIIKHRYDFVLCSYVGASFKRCFILDTRLFVWLKLGLNCQTEEVETASYAQDACVVRLTANFAVCRREAGLYMRLNHLILHSSCATVLPLSNTSLACVQNCAPESFFLPHNSADSVPKQMYWREADGLQVWKRSPPEWLSHAHVARGLWR